MPSTDLGFLTNEHDIRQNLLAEVIKVEKGSLVVNEFVLSWGSRRIDIAIFEPKTTVGFEIKSDKDTLRRLPEQAEFFSKFFDFNYLVCGQKHIESAKDLIPDYCGIYEVVAKSPTDIQISQLRQATASTDIDPIILLEVIWKEELLVILSEKIAVNWRIKKLSCGELRRLICENMQLIEIKTTVCHTLINRQNWRKPIK